MEQGSAVQFTKEQLHAIDHRKGNLQLIACAGSGKTEVVARRVAALLDPKRSKLAPRNIIAFTFTDKAAAELKQRITERCREELGDITGLAEMYVGTIHGFCLELLKTEAPKYLKYEVLNDVQQILFIDRNSKKAGLTTSTDLEGKPLKRWVDTGRYAQALSIFREAAVDEKALKDCTVWEGFDLYLELLEEKSQLDYSGILYAAVEVLLSDDELRKRLTERVKEVIVDEYQDLNPVQEAVVHELHELGARICVVGDDDQTIYQWRGSDVRNILKFAKRYPAVKQIKLEENFRSSEGVVATARAFIEQNTERLPKAMKPTAAQDYEPGDLVATSFDTPEEEAAWIARTCRQLRGVAIKDDEKQRGISWSDMAILLRSVRKNGEAITQALQAAEIPFVVAGMNNLFDTLEAEATRQLFYFMVGEADDRVLLKAWEDARTGATKANLKSAIASATQVRMDMAKGDKPFSFYSIQRQFLTFLEESGIREESVPNERGEVLFYNLGKFSQLISDFETIHYHSAPVEKYKSFAGFLKNGAEEAYPEGWQDNQYANPDAVRIMTVHQAKGMQWPVVFIPALLRNRFPSKAQGGRSVWHLIPTAAVKSHERYRGTLEDERRLFYVAMTRSQKFLFFTWAPIHGNQLYQKVSEFWENVLASPHVKRKIQDYSKRKRLAPKPRPGIANVVLSFSDLKYFFECPYQFKLRILYGFNAPIHEALGYGKSLHDALAEVHQRAIRKDYAKDKEVPDLLARHLHTPYAYPALREKLEKAAEKVLTHYLADNRKDFANIEFSEKNIDINLGDGVSVIGRIDLVRRLDTNKTYIVDLKSNDCAQPEEVTETQLHIYALGYEELTGRRADFVETYALEERKRTPRSVDDDFIKDVKAKVRGAAAALRSGDMPVAPAPKKCAGCDYRRLCTAGAKAAAKA